jgi:hypothetical protein
MLGQWKLKNGLYAEITNIGDVLIFGYIECSGYKIPSFWNKDGDSVYPEFNLVFKRRSVEQEWKKENCIEILCPNCRQVLQVNIG